MQTTLLIVKWTESIYLWGIHACENFLRLPS